MIAIIARARRARITRSGRNGLRRLHAPDLDGRPLDLPARLTAGGER
jgi:hypothetical protein